MSLMTLTYQGVAYKSYASIVEADTVLTVDPTRRTAWGDLADDAKILNLVAATYRLDILPWTGKKAGGPSQENAWPRSGMTYADGTDIAEDAIPDELERATALLAGSIQIRPAQAERGGIPNAIKSLRAGAVAIEYANPERSETPSHALQDETAYQLVRLWLRGRGGALSTGALAFGTDAGSSFSDRDRYDYNRGW